MGSLSIIFLCSVCPIHLKNKGGGSKGRLFFQKPKRAVMLLSTLGIKVYGQA